MQKKTAIGLPKENSGSTKKMLERWRQQKDILHKTKKSQKAFRTKAPFWPELENELEIFVLQQWAACRALNTVQLRMKAVEMAKSLEIPNFKGGPLLVLPLHEEKKPEHSTENYPLPTAIC
jgi:hypothetical protein